MSEIKIDSALFSKRLALLQKSIKDKNIFKEEVDSILIVTGATDDDNPYKKSTILHNWLLGYEFPATAILITSDSITILTSANKAKILSPLKDVIGVDNFSILIRSKDSDQNSKLFQDFIDIVISKGSKIGILPKDKFEGKFYQDWTDNYYSKNESKFDKLDISTSLSKVLEIKDIQEQNLISIASKISTNLMVFFTDEMINAADEELNITNSQLSEKIENKIDDSKFFQQMEKNKSMKKLGPDFDLNQVDWCYNPIVQSGHDFDLRPSAQSNDKKLESGVIISAIGSRYKSYCSNIARTFLIDPSKEIEKNYDFMLSVYRQILNYLKDGIIAKDIYNKILNFIIQERPDLEKHFLKNCGWLMGLDYKDSTLILNSKNERVLHEDSIININIGFQNLKDKENNVYSLLISDTVKVTKSEPILLTDLPKNRSEISFYFKDDNEDVKREVKDEDKLPNGKPKKISDRVKSEINTNSKILKSKLRTETKNHDEDQEKIKRELQKQLLEKRRKEGLAKYSKSDAIGDVETKAVFKRYESYLRESQIPSNVKDLKIHIDSKTQTIILPICGRPVPFHINSFKSGSKTEEGDYTTIRLNFNSPGGVNTRRDELPYEDGPDKQFIRSLTFRSKDGARMTEVLKKIQDLKKEATKRENEKKQMADVVTQAKLIEVRGIGRGKRLDQVFIRPGPDSKRVAGYVEIHQNGLRYQSPIRNDQKVDVLFSNIKHLFFQPCKDELIVLIHCHLKTPIMIGKKKTRDVQFYREASDMAYDETGNKKRRYRYGDEDELEQEQEERRRKLLLDKEFKAFAEQISEASNGLVDLDIPFRELGFNGVPFRSSVFCIPTRDCLVQLIDPPFLVITLDEIEIVHLERVQFGLKNFDMVFVYKDFSTVSVNTIDVALLDDIKNWLSDVDIPVTSGPVNLNWSAITKTILADPYQFYVDGGWSFLDAEDSDDSEEESEEEDVFEPEDDEPSSDEYDESAEDAESDFSEGSGSGSGSDEDNDDVASEEDEEGEVWSD
ncbi:hypothetical protein PACTADRAFT_18304 [Pachysolen tannophilus NRRL Y-2460]|uniref:FACT complex subunit n=1 Tax=Pachysolen tannophilus NRRL Y-2460 TaxID=669874 RepID=A0A1E4TPM2_PACTA|nr:hypothetical protein PACTADRAFT_18304 [Pachysolen tannophilus NRRL Y-2460]